MVSQVNRTASEPETKRAHLTEPVAQARVRVDGKFFSADGQRFRFNGVTYGTFRPREDGALFPTRDAVKRDFEAMSLHGVTVVRTYTAPPDDVVELAADYGLRLLAGIYYPDWRYLLGSGRRAMRRVSDQAAAVVRREARRLANEPAVLGLCVGNEIPADVLRWYGTRPIQRTISRLVEEVRSADDHLLVTYANYPTTEYLELPDLDFLTFNVFLERQQDFRRYLTRLQHLAGDRPLVLGEVGLDASGEEGEVRQAEVLDWQLATALERGAAGTCVFSWTDEWNVGGSDVEGWKFGLTTADRTPRPALAVYEKWTSKSVRDLQERWPTLTVIVCAYNAAATINECLSNLCALDYPGLEVVVVDDGSTDSTPEIARRYPRARLLTIEHAGLATARNAGYAAATGDVVAYLDADAYPTREWPYYLVLGLDGPIVAGAGGPNVPPPTDGTGGQIVARAPGGPVHVLFTDDRAEHVPGCNMAFWKNMLAETGGFDPIYTAAGDDVDICWKVLDRGWEIGFHPAAQVWHHRRPGLRQYLRQQKGYGRAEALVEQRHPDRFNPAGSARWRGRIYNSLTPGAARQRVYRGLYGAAAFQSIYRSGGHALDLAHQVGVPLSVMSLLLIPVAVWVPAVAAVPAAAVLLWICLGVIEAARVRVPRRFDGSRAGFRARVAACHLLQPLARTYARLRQQILGDKPAGVSFPTASRVSGDVIIYANTSGRPDLVAAVISALRSGGVRLAVPSGWEDYDARISASWFLAADIVSSGYPEGWVQVLLRTKPRWRRLVLVGAVAAIVGLYAPYADLAMAGVVADLLVGVGKIRSCIAQMREGGSAGTAAPLPDSVEHR
jgi:glycosyltransferase involved in cell wall biosynthesis/exo-beta-1,3-glucanase (GH17 family)